MESIQLKLPGNWKKFAERIDLWAVKMHFGELKNGIYDASCPQSENGTLLIVSSEKGKKKAFLLREENLNAARQTMPAAPLAPSTTSN